MSIFVFSLNIAELTETTSIASFKEKRASTMQAPCNGIFPSSCCQSIPSAIHKQSVIYSTPVIVNLKQIPQTNQNIVKKGKKIAQ